jgi:hypothetical protein
MATEPRKPSQPYYRPVQGPRGAESPLGGRTAEDKSYRSNGAGKIVAQPIEAARGTQKPILPRRFNQSPLVG